jgi:PKHD-type hydroxylase
MSLLSGSASYIQFAQIFSIEECEQIVALARSSGQFKQGKLWSDEERDYVLDTHRRRVLTSRHPRDTTTSWIFEKMDRFFSTAAGCLGVSVKEQVQEDLKVMFYCSGGHFRAWHRDVGEGDAANRIISMSVELSHPSTYKGGRLEIYPDAIGRTAVQAPMGGGIAFLSDRLHRVTPIRKGERYSLVNWTN